MSLENANTDGGGHRLYIIHFYNFNLENNTVNEVDGTRIIIIIQLENTLVYL